MQDDASLFVTLEMCDMKTKGAWSKRNDTAVHAHKRKMEQRPDRMLLRQVVFAAVQAMVFKRFVINEVQGWRVHAMCQEKPVPVS